MNTHAISSVTGRSTFCEKNQPLRSRLPCRAPRQAFTPAAQAWKKDNDGARPVAKSYVQDGARMLVTLAAAQLIALPIAGSALAEVVGTAQLQQAVPELAEVVNPESRNLGPNEVNADSINEISAYASNEDKFAPGRAGSTFGDPEAAASGNTSKEAQFKKSAGDASADSSGGGVKDIGSTPPSITDKIKEVFNLSEAPVVNPESRNLGPNEVNADSINEISAYASDEDKFAPGRAGSTFGDPAAAAVGDTSKEAQFKKSAGDASADSSGGGAKDLGSTPPSITDKIKEVFNLSEAPVVNPESRNLGPNEVNADSINEISAYASDEDKFAPGRAGSTFGDPAAAAVGDTSKEAQFKKSAGDASADSSGGGVKDIGSTPPSIADKVKAVFNLSEAPEAINPESRNLGPNEVDASAIDKIAAFASDKDKAAPGRAGSTFGDPAAAAVGDTSAETQFKKSAGDASEAVGRAVDDVGGQAEQATSGVRNKIAELFNLSAINPESQNLGPNEVSQGAIDRIASNASPADKAAPGRAGSTFGNPAAASRGDTSAATQFTKAAGDATKNTLGKALGGDAKQASSGGLVGRIKALFNLAAAPDSRNPSPNEITKDVVGRVPGISQIDQKAPGRANTQQGGTQEVGQGINAAVQNVKEGVQQAGNVQGLGDKVRQALPDLSELPSVGEAVQAGQDLLNKAGAAAGTEQGSQQRPDLLEQGIRGALAKAPDNLSNPKGAPYTEAASKAIKEAVSNVVSGDK